MVNEDNLVLAMLLDNIQVKYKDFQKDYHDRSITQWKIYLLEQMGFKLASCFGWGINGIYSYDLNERIYDCLINRKSDDLEEYKFKKTYQNHLDEFANIGTEKPDTIDNYNWWMLLSSICFWKEKDDNWKDSLNHLLQPDVLMHQQLADACLTKHIKHKREVK